MRLVSIASGSSGNCIYVGSDTTHILIDAGISCKRIKEGLEKLDISLGDLDGIFVTHEHSDHIAGLKTLLKKHDVPVFATRGTLAGIDNADKKGDMPDFDRRVIKADEKIALKDLVINPMSISHDALEPVAYRVSYGDKKIAVATDMGCYTDYTIDCLQGLDALLIEANHDVRMLQMGPYPYQLKRRILGDKGHLSNEKSGELLTKLLNDKMKGILLGHLSKENNLPELAYETVRVEIEMSDTPYHGNDFPLYVASRSEQSPIIEV